MQFSHISLPFATLEKLQVFAHLLLLNLGLFVLFANCSGTPPSKENLPLHLAAGYEHLGELFSAVCSPPVNCTGILFKGNNRG